MVGKLPELSRSLWNELFFIHVDDCSELGFIEFAIILLGWCSKSAFARWHYWRSFIA